MIRVLGRDNKASSVQLGQKLAVRGPDGQVQTDEAGLPLTRICDLARGKYDLTVETGPSYASRRQETADQILKMIQAYPPAAPVLGDLLAKNLDWPDADEVARRLHALLPPQLLAAEGVAANPLQHPVVKQAAQQAVAAIGGLQQKAAALGQQKLQIDAFKAATERLKAVGEAARAPVGRG